MSQADEDDVFAVACVKLKDMNKRFRFDPDDKLCDVDVEVQTCDDLDPIRKPKAKIVKKSRIDQDDECDDLAPITKPKKSKAKMKKAPIDQDDEPLLDDSNKDMDLPLIMKKPKKVFPTTFAEVKVRAFFFAFII
jgi:hypothetical protein